ncbi:uncharacterized protein LOC142173703 [Nicotiana tabacum]|uniref:Uncharacterized protein LOC142173703 n=1 Tax=Nicotiana tabacum TaxID=4097 RepID=A0AC58TDW8_TOBAC
MYGKQVMVILTDSGSTHNFVASETAKQLGCVIQLDAPMRVTTANGSNLMSYYSCPQFKWKMQGIDFEHKLRLLDIGGFDIVLGVDWMRKHNPIVFDFIEYRLQVSVKGKRVELKGFSEEGESIHEQITELLAEFPRVFAEPKSLLPQMSHDHFISLNPNASPISIRPYMYNHFQTNEIEKQVTDMLNNGTIQPSHSPFSSPVLQVKKKDGS